MFKNLILDLDTFLGIWFWRVELNMYLLVVSIERHFFILTNIVLHLRYQFWHVDLYFYFFLANIILFFRTTLLQDFEVWWTVFFDSFLHSYWTIVDSLKCEKSILPQCFGHGFGTMAQEMNVKNPVFNT